MTPKDVYDEYLDNVKARYEINHTKCYNCKHGTIEVSYESNYAEFDERFDNIYCFKTQGWVGQIEDCDDYDHLPEYKKQKRFDN